MRINILHNFKLLSCTCFCVIIFAFCGLNTATAANEQPDSLEPVCPVLPAQGKNFNDFLPLHWLVLALAEFDFNGDGLTDIVTVIERKYPYDDNATYGHDDPWHPRILFVLQNQGQDYTLSFQDENAVRARDEGGVFGDPWEGLSAAGNSFTIGAYGGSGWRWSESRTYKYIKSRWVLAQSQDYSWAHSILIGDFFCDYEAGAGKFIVGDYEGIDYDNYDWEKEEPKPFEITYAVKLDAPPALAEYNLLKAGGFRNGAVIHEIREVTTLPDMRLTAEDVPPPPAAEPWNSNILFRTPQFMGYTFSKDDVKYLALYYHDSGRADVVLQDKPGQSYDSVCLYQNRIYFVCKAANAEKNYVIAEIRSINLKGGDAKTLFSHTIADKNASLYLPFEIYGGEIIVNVYPSGEPQSFYRVSINGGKAELIGRFPDHNN